MTASKPEPVTLVPIGWTCSAETGDFANERLIRCTRDGAVAVLTRWQGDPELPGDPMQIASRREVRVDGGTVELLRTAMFEGEPDDVDVLFLSGEGWTARLVLRGCDNVQEAAVLAGVRIAGHARGGSGETPVPDARPLHHAPFTLSPHLRPWQAACDRVRAHPSFGEDLYRQLVSGLESPGAPEALLRRLSALTAAARSRHARAGRQADFTFDGLDLVEADLRTRFFKDLCATISTHAGSDTARKIAALQTLIPLAEAPPPVGFPDPNPRVEWTLLPRLNALAAVSAAIEVLEEQGE